MNAFYEHHQDSIRFGYRCFDRILLNGLIQPFQQPERVIGFFNTYRNQYPVGSTVWFVLAQDVPPKVRNRTRAPMTRGLSAQGHKDTGMVRIAGRRDGLPRVQRLAACSDLDGQYGAWLGSSYFLR
jgi:hypothetical protein